MPINHLYDTWTRQIRELRPDQRTTQIRNFVWLIIGIYQSRSENLSRIAGKIPGPAKLLSTTRRLSRLLSYPGHPRTRMVRACRPGVGLETQFRHMEEIRLIVMAPRLASVISR